MSPYESAVEYGDDLWDYSAEYWEPYLDGVGEEPEASDSDLSLESWGYSRPAYRAPRVEVSRSMPASKVVKEAWAEVSTEDPELFARWTQGRGGPGRQPSDRMCGVPETRFRKEVLARVLTGQMHNVGAVVDLKSLTRDEPELDFTYLNEDEAQRVHGAIVANGENFSMTLRWVELLEDCYKETQPQCPDLESGRQRRREVFLRVVWTERDVLPDPIGLNADSTVVIGQLEAIAASLNDKVKLAEVKRLLDDPSVQRRVLAALEAWRQVPESFMATGSDKLCEWVREVIVASEADAFAFIEELTDGQPACVSKDAFDAQLVSLARDSLVDVDATSALCCRPSINSEDGARQGYLSAAPLNQALYQRLRPIFRNGSPVGVDHDSLPGQLEVEGRRCATWIGVDSDFARLTLLLGSRVIVGVGTILSSWAVARRLPKDALNRRVADSARLFASLRMEFSPSRAITGGKSTIYTQIICGMESEYMRRLWRALHRREFTGNGATLDLPTITKTLTDTMFTITSWVDESCRAEQRRTVMAPAKPVARPAQLLMSYLSGYLHEDPLAADPHAAKAAQALEAYLAQRPSTHGERRTSARARANVMNRAELERLARLAIETVSTIQSCCDASDTLRELRGQATDDDILDFIGGM